MKTRIGAALILLVLALSLTTTTIIAQNNQNWTPTTITMPQQPTPKTTTITWGNETRANTNTTNNQNYPSVCCRSDGSFIIVWASHIQDGDGQGVFAKIFDSSGKNLTDDIQVNTYTTGDQDLPSICCSDGSLIVARTSDGQDGSGDGVYFRVGSLPSLPNVFLLFVFLYLMQSMSASGGTMLLLVVGGLLVVVVLAVLGFLLWRRRV